MCRPSLWQVPQAAQVGNCWKVCEDGGFCLNIAVLLQDRSLLGSDPVLWYTFGVTHFVRPEDYPVMPCDVIGFTLKPVGFFEANPALVSGWGLHCPDGPPLPLTGRGCLVYRS